MPGKTDDPIVVVGMACRLPGCDNVAEFEELLFNGRNAIAEMPAERLDRNFYHDSKRGKAGKTYTTLGGCVPDRIPNPDRTPDGISPESIFDPAHLQFCDVAVSAWQNAGLSVGDEVWQNSGVFVGHSGGTALGGPLGLATQIEEALSFLNDIPEFAGLDANLRERLCRNVSQAMRQNRPRRSPQHGPQYNAYLAASLAARTLGVNGPRLVVDGACASSLMALDHAIMAIRAGRITSAIVGGATYNGADNLILFSQSQACSDTGSRPFDDNANGLISAEGYVAVFITTLSRAIEHDLSIEALITGIGVSSDGRGRSLWAPRREGQELALRRAYADRTPLDIDYLEAHATSTQLGDATELESVNALAAGRSSSAPVRIGSVKSNIGHTLESAGLIGLVKVMLSLRRREFAPSINVSNLNQTFDWSDGRIDVVRRVEPWIPNGQHRRAGVSAFGIGGLNAHLHVEEYSSETRRPVADTEGATASNHEKEPIAIIGRGVVLPEAFDVAAFHKLLQEGRSAITHAPQERWRDGIGIEPSDKSSAFRSPTSRGGFITGFEFDGQSYRIPPKQVQQANPIQMMLLDAVRQAVEEFDGGEWSFDRERTAVVIGTIFGTEFGNQLQIGLRLPEICQQIEQHLHAEGISVDSAAITAAFRDVVLRNRPALLDETGSFTASTLASRVAKTFDLMGGAGAVDADDSSGLAALSIAVDKLRAGQCDTIICGAAHRAMDLSAFEELKMNGRLAHSGRIEDIPDDCSRILPGEGVVTLLLCRQSDAIKNGAKILGLINDIDAGVLQTDDVSTASDAADASLVRQIGYLSGSQPLVRLVSETLRWQQGNSSSGEESVYLSSRASDGFAIQVKVSVSGRLPEEKSATKENISLRAQQQKSTKPQSMITLESYSAAEPTLSTSASHIFRIGAATANDFESQLKAAAANPAQTGQREFGTGDVFRLAVCSDGAAPLNARIDAVLQAFTKGVRRQVFDRENAVLWQQTSELPRVAWLFPGQGSQYGSVPAVMACPIAARCLAEIDEILVRMGFSPLTPALSDDDGRLGRDVWLTQLWVLGVGTALARSLAARGYRPDFVLGHSFGEYVAAVAAGVISLEQAVRIIRHRSDAVIMNTRERGVLLSIKGALNEVDAVLRESGLPLTITHINSPTQTVVAGPEDAVKTFRKALSNVRLASIVVPVPAPFHTSMLANAETAMARAVSGEQLRPPSCGFLSATSGEFLGEPDDIRRSMVTQLTQPVLYQPAVRRLIDANSLILLEVGPNDVLTRLNREIIPNDGLCMSLDVPGQEYQQRVRLLDAMMDCVFSQPTTTHSSAPAVDFQPQTGEVSTTRSQIAVTDEVEIIDVTRSRRRKSAATEAVSAADIESPKKPARQNGHAVAKPLSVQETRDSTPQADQAEIVRNFLLDLVVELTGYSRDILDFDADLEAELGLDSIKTAQIIGELAEWADLNVAPSDLRLSDIRSLADIAALTENCELPVATALADPASELSNGLVVPTADATPATSELARTVETLLVDFVVDLTGYDRDIVDLDADLEAELGLDSIKIAQIVGEMQEQFELSAIRADQLSLGDFRTLRSIQSFVLKSITKHNGGTKPVEEPVAEPIVELVPPARIAPFTETTPITSDVPDVIGVEPYDQLPEDWAALFQARSDADNAETAWQAGFERGAKQRPEIRAALRLLVDTVAHDASDLQAKTSTPQWNEIAEQEMRGLSSGAGVVMESVRFAASVTQGGEDVSTPNGQILPPSNRQRKGTHRFALRMTEAPRREGMPSMPVLNGPALILGGSELAAELATRIQSTGQKTHVLENLADLNDTESRLNDIWRAGATPHLFILSPFDSNAISSLNAVAWEARRIQALQIPFRVCQLWMQKVIDANLMEDATVVTCSRLGGDLGFSGSNVQSPESLAGLIKAMLIECWMREFRTTPMKVVDIAPETSVELAVDGILNELAVPSYDMEVSVSGTERLSVQAFPAPLSKQRNGTRRGREITRGGNWIVSGGGRGITAMTAMALAERHDLKLHLLGTAPVPNVSEMVRKAALENRSQLRRQIMATAADGENPVELWRNTEKAIEIDITLQECRQRGIQATYHSCDVSSIHSVSSVLAEVRRKDGPIHGVLHGAGAGQDSRFDRKRPDKVEKCLRAKIDGAVVLMDQTRQDPLEWFAAYGSISGRFGANGHTDYSLANDMMSKLVDRYRSERPDVSSVTFHWHAWGDVGMATKPEARLALEMIDMEFMPAEEGVQHFLAEFEYGGDEPEVLITDYSYFGKFFPAERINNESSVSVAHRLPMLSPGQTNRLNGSGPFSITLDPLNDRFLSQHKVAQRPTLPFVVAIELMAEAARQSSGRNSVIKCRNVVANQAIKFATDDPLVVSVFSESTSGKWMSCRLAADVRRRDGRLVESDRTFFHGEFKTTDEDSIGRATLPATGELNWELIKYLDRDAPIYHGPELQCLRKIAIDSTGGWGMIAASAPVQLFGANRTRGWTVPCATMDACLYAVAVVAWRKFERASLPVKFGAIRISRLPDPGEPCIVRVGHLREAKSGMTCHFRLQGLNGDVFLDVKDFEVAWLG